MREGKEQRLMVDYELVDVIYQISNAKKKINITSMISFQVSVEKN